MSNTTVTIGGSEPLRRSARRANLAFRIGALVQGIVLGVLLDVAVYQLIIKAGDVQLFRYQGF